MAANCVDGVKNGGEGGLDCGLVCPFLCGPWMGCEQAADCLGNECEPQLKYCVPNCFDTVHNNGEADPDCGGPCVLKCPNITGHCNIDADCISNNCDATGHCAA